MAAGVMLDTSFLITLADRRRAHHEAARRYWRHFMEGEMPIFLSAIVVSEFCIRQEIPADILRSCVVCPFNWDDAQRAAKLDWSRLRSGAGERGALKDDMKIIAQAAVMDAEFAITDDSETFYRYCQTLKESGEVQFKAIKLEEGFDRAFFDSSGQRDFHDELSGEPETDQ